MFKVVSAVVFSFKAIPSARSRNTGLNSDELVARDLFKFLKKFSSLGISRSGAS